VYYRGRRRAEGGRQPQVYLGAGLVGEVRASPSEGRLICAVEDFESFAEPVPFKLDGEYLEPLGTVPAHRAGLYFRQGVRSIDEETFARILAAAAAGDPTAGRRRRQVAIPYAAPETARLVDEIAIELARKWLADTHGEASVHLMPHNNPGYDIRVDAGALLVEYVEVKGTTRSVPHFYMSEGERLFSIDNASRYTLLVVYGIDIVRREGSIHVRRGGRRAADAGTRARRRGAIRQRRGRRSRGRGRRSRAASCPARLRNTAEPAHEQVAAEDEQAANHADERPGRRLVGLEVTGRG
jgi:Domain of unknown function (DUF3883)